MRSSRDFRRVMATGRRVEGAGVRLHVAPRGAPEAPARLGISATSTRGAVGRNRIKRRLRAAFRAAPVRGTDVVAVATDATGDSRFQDLVETMKSATRRGAGG